MPFAFLADTDKARYFTSSFFSVSNSCRRDGLLRLRGVLAQSKRAFITISTQCVYDEVLTVILPLRIGTGTNLGCGSVMSLERESQACLYCQQYAS